MDDMDGWSERELGKSVEAVQFEDDFDLDIIVSDVVISENRMLA